MNRWLNFIYPMLRDKEGEGSGGGAGGGEGEGAGSKEPTLKDVLAEINAIKAENAALKARLEGSGGGEGDLNDKVRKQKEEKEKSDTDTRNLEGAVAFNYNSKDFLKNHESILPEDAKDIFATADKETYSSAVHKARSVKAALVQSFFSVQDNVDILTASQKSQLANYLKLTKDVKEERAEQVYENLLEPVLESRKRERKAQELAKSREGLANEGDSDKIYRENLFKQGKRKYLGEKNA